MAYTTNTVNSKHNTKREKSKQMCLKKYETNKIEKLNKKKQKKTFLWSKITKIDCNTP